MTETQDWLTKLQADSLSRLEAVSRMQRELESLVGEAHSPDRYVRVRVNPAGALLALGIDDQALALGGEQLAAAIVDAVSRATAEVGERMQEIVGDLVPPDDLEAALRGAVPPSTQRQVEDELAARRKEGF